MRAFVGLVLPEPVREVLIAVRTAILDADPAWGRDKWVEDENLHVTLHFLGEVSPETLEEGIRRMRTDLAAMRPFTLGFGRTQARPRAAEASMLWMRAIHGEAEAGELAGAICDIFPPTETERRFKAHVTLCRARRAHPLGAAAIAAAETVLGRAGAARLTMSVASVRVFESTLSGSGPQYRTVADVELGGD